MGMDQTCNDDLEVSALEGQCVAGARVCKSGYEQNPATGKCRIVDGGAPGVCVYGRDVSCNAYFCTAAVLGTCLANGTCQCNQGSVIDPWTGKCRIPVQFGCTPGFEGSCNEDPCVSSLWGTCLQNGTCQCVGGFVVNPLTGKCHPQ